MTPNPIAKMCVMVGRTFNNNEKISPKLYLEFSLAGKTRRCVKEGQICKWWRRCCPELKCARPKGEKRSRCMAGKTFNDYKIKIIIKCFWAKCVNDNVFI